MFRKTTLALLAGASSLIAVPHHAMAIDAAAPAGPAVIYANQGAPQPPMRTAYAQPQRSNMGGGFIEFLFGDAPSSQGYSPQPMYQQQPGYYGNWHSYNYFGPYYGGAYVTYWDRLPYACGVYGYC